MIAGKGVRMMEVQPMLPLRVLVGSRDPGVSKILEGVHGRDYRLLPACPPKAAVKEALREEYDVLVLDLETQSDRQAKEAVRALHRVPPSLRIILLASMPAVDNVAVIEEGIFSYLTKPVRGALAESV